MEIKLANPRGFCAGVDRAIDIVNLALDQFGAPVYVRHEVVHNKFVVDQLRERGAVFVDEIDEIPDNVVVIFSAHGVSQKVQKEAISRQLKVFDATCPLVTKVHIEVSKFSADGKECILIGHEGHPEVEGTMGQYDHSAGGDIYLVEDEQDQWNDLLDDGRIDQTSFLKDLIPVIKPMEMIEKKFPGRVKNLSKRSFFYCHDQIEISDLEFK